MINRDFIQRRIEELELRRWWIAEQLGVSRRTLHRWLSGDTSRIDRDKLAALASLLDTSTNDLVLPHEPLSASSNDQLRAARTLLDSDLLQSAMPPHQFSLFETLARGLVVPGLSQSELARLYVAIALALFRQGKLEDAWHYAVLAGDLAEAAHDHHSQLRANMLLAAREGLTGDAAKALAMDEANLDAARDLGDTRLIAGNLSNVADQYIDTGRFKESLLMQHEAIDLYQALALYPNLAFCHLGLVTLHLKQGDFKAAKHALGEARKSSRHVNFLRGLADCDAFEAVILAEQGCSEPAVQLIESALAQYHSLEISETRMHLQAGRVYRLTGNRRASRRWLVAGLKLARGQRLRSLQQQVEKELALVP